MSAYVYRVTAKTVKLDDGRTAHVAQYAYKPYGFGFDAAKENQRAARLSGCYASERMTLKTPLIVSLSKDGQDGVLYNNPTGVKTFYDDTTFGTDRMPQIGTVTLKPGRPLGVYSVTYAAEVTS